MEVRARFLAEIQALVSKTPFPRSEKKNDLPGSIITEFLLLSLHFGKRVRLNLSNQDAYVNVTGE